jgi:hypothetical protein
MIRKYNVFEDVYVDKDVKYRESSRKWITDTGRAVRWQQPRLHGSLAGQDLAKSITPYVVAPATSLLTRQETRLPLLNKGEYWNVGRKRWAG